MSNDALAHVAPERLVALGCSPLPKYHAPDDLHEAGEVPNHQVISLRHITRQDDTLDRRERLQKQAVLGVVWCIGDPLGCRPALGLRLGLGVLRVGALGRL